MNVAQTPAPDRTTDMAPRDHGGGLDAAIAAHGGTRAGWIDLSTGINPVPYPLPALPTDCWTALPDKAAENALIEAARAFWGVPAGASVIAAPGASALIARMPLLAPTGGPRTVAIPGPTYNEHAAAFRFHGWQVQEAETGATARVVVHPNNPDGRLWPARPASAPSTTAGTALAAAPSLEVIDESFCDVMPEASRVPEAVQPGTVILKSFGKFWGLAGLRLGFAIGAPETVGPLCDHLGPWPVAGPALAVATAALRDDAWAQATRARLADDAARLDALMAPQARLIGGTTLFRLYETPRAGALQTRLARAHIWSRRFPYAPDWLRLGLPRTDGWDRLAAALA